MTDVMVEKIIVVQDNGKISVYSPRRDNKDLRCWFEDLLCLVLDRRFLNGSINFKLKSFDHCPLCKREISKKKEEESEK